jgi:hypothetical protein
MIYDPLALFATLMVFLHHTLEQREQESKPQVRHTFLPRKRGRYVTRRMGIFLMRIGGKLVYLGSASC